MSARRRTGAHGQHHLPEPDHISCRRRWRAGHRDGVQMCSSPAPVPRLPWVADCGAPAQQFRPSSRPRRGLRTLGTVLARSSSDQSGDINGRLRRNRAAPAVRPDDVRMAAVPALASRCAKRSPLPRSEFIQYDGESVERLVGSKGRAWGRTLPGRTTGGCRTSVGVCHRLLLGVRHIAGGPAVEDVQRQIAARVNGHPATMSVALAATTRVFHPAAALASRYTWPMVVVPSCSSIAST